MPIDYSKAKIYCIRSPNTDLIYIGATCQKLSQRMGEHRMNLKRDTKITSKFVLECGDAYIELLENYPCANKEELSKKENEYIRTQNCCNKRIEGRTKQQYREEHKQEISEQRKEYYKRTKEQNKEQRKQYYEANKEVISEQCKLRYEANKEAILEKCKQYRERKKQESNT